jgi:hypothetical protein
VQADEVDTGIGPVFALEETRVRWTFIGFALVKIESGRKSGRKRRKRQHMPRPERLG